MACQEKTNGKPKVEVQMSTIQGDSAQTTAALAVEGMMCAHACGGKIQQELKKLPGVRSTSVDFIEDRKVNIVKVDFDANVTDEQKMMFCINEMADGKYTVVSAQRNTVIGK